MKIVMRANKQLRIEDSRLDEYLKAGYCEIDATGKPLKESVEKPASKPKK